MTTISIQPQQYICKFIEAEVNHLLQTEARKLNKSPLETSVTLPTVIIDIIQLTDITDHSRPLKHPYYAPLPVVIYFDQLSDKNPNIDGTFSQHLLITISIGQKLFYFKQAGLSLAEPFFIFSSDRFRQAFKFNTDY